MFIPPQKIQQDLKSGTSVAGKVQLKSSHLVIDHEIVDEIFGNALNANVVYYPDRRSLLVAPESDELFKQLHKAKQHMLKARNAKGDKTIALHELLIDHDIDQADRVLNYRNRKELSLLNVTL